MTAQNTAGQHWLAALRALVSLPAHDPDLAAAQLDMLAGQVPLMYAILLSNALALTVTHYGVAPKLLTVVLPVVLMLMGLWRFSLWMRWRDRRVTDTAMLVRRLRNVVFATLLLGASFTAWSLSLFRYGGPYLQCHVEFFMTVTLICCNICLMQLRTAALLLTAIVTVPSLVFFILTRQPVLIAIAFNMVLVTVGMMLVLLRNHDTFNDLVISKRELTRRQLETQRLSDENLRVANLDALTSLPNRRRFFAELEQTLAVAAQNGRRFAVALIDLDRFKGVNDVYGHAAGDRLLTQIGLRLKRVAGGDVFIARLGGDEFGAILPDCLSDADIAAFSATIRHALDGPCVIGDRLATIGCSIGAAIYPQAGSTGDELFERADYALFHGKQEHRGGFVIFSEEHEINIRQAAKIEQVFRAADYEAEMRVMFQPIIDVIASRVIAFEALARWQSVELGPVGPDVFIPIAERTQAIGALTAVLLTKALAAARSWPATVSVCFNLSAQNLCCPETMATLRQIVKLSGVPPSRIEFEVTETALLQDFDQAAAAIDRLHVLGARVALDDFGTGFSSLGYVHRLHLDKIKIDKSFVSDVVQGRTAPAIIKTIVMLCQNLQLDCVVEGVETEAQLRAVAILGCTHIQGHFLSKPVEEAAVTRLVEKIASLGRARALADIALPQLGTVCD